MIKLNRKQKKEICRSYNETCNLSEVARKFNVSYNTVKTICIQYDVFVSREAKHSLKYNEIKILTEKDIEADIKTRIFK